MILSQELRLGNMVLVPNLWEDQFFNVIELYSGECSVSPTTQNEARTVSYRDLNPISLTISLLQDFGFTVKQHGIQTLTSYISLNQGMHHLYLNADFQFVKSPTDPVPLTNYPIRYFHQLQNIFYLVTGQELSVFSSQR